MPSTRCTTHLSGSSRVHSETRRGCTPSGAPLPRHEWDLIRAGYGHKPVEFLHSAVVVALLARVKEAAANGGWITANRVALSRLLEPVSLINAAAQRRI